MWTPWRLPKFKMDKLELPPLEKGFYWVFFKEARLGPEVEIRRRKAGIFHSRVATHFTQNASRNSYNSAVEYCYQDYKRWIKHHKEEWV